MSQWIKCSEGMPEIGINVLVYMDGPIHSTTPYAVASFDKYGFSRSRVIAWQPLPSPPEAE